MTDRFFIGTFVAVLLGAASITVSASANETQGSTREALELAGVYQAVPPRTTLPGGLRNQATPAEIPLAAAAREQAKQADLAHDPANLCQPVGPFRMMAREGLKFEFVPARGLMMMLFEDVSRGHVRTIRLDRLPEEIEPTWHGHSVGRWEGATLVVETTAFNDRIWLNDAGVKPSEALRLVERWRPVLGGRYLEYVSTIEDPHVLARPYRYTRYFEKVSAEIGQDICEE